MCIQQYFTEQEKKKWNKKFLSLKNASTIEEC